MILNSELVPVFSLYCVDYAARFGEHTDDVIREYARQIISHNIGRNGLKRGIERLIARAGENKFTPNPTEFALMCKPTAADLGIPDFETALQEVREARTSWRYRDNPFPYSHDICRYMSQRIGYELSQLSERDWRNRASTEYSRLLKAAMSGALPKFKHALEPVKAETRPAYEQCGYKTLGKEEARKVIEAMTRRPFAGTEVKQEAERGRVDTSRLGPGIAGSSDANCTTAAQMTGSKPE